MSSCSTGLYATLLRPRESKQPGEILATRKILAASLGFLPTASVTSYQLLYRTQDQYGNPLATAATIFVPLIHSKDTLVSFAVAEDSGVNSCAPSYQCKSSPIATHTDFRSLWLRQLKLACTGRTCFDSDYSVSRYAGYFATLY